MVLSNAEYGLLATLNADIRSIATGAFTRLAHQLSIVIAIGAVVKFAFIDEAATIASNLSPLAPAAALACAFGWYASWFRFAAVGEVLAAPGTQWSRRAMEYKTVFAYILVLDISLAFTVAARGSVGFLPVFLGTLFVDAFRWFVRIRYPKSVLRVTTWSASLIILALLALRAANELSPVDGSWRLPALVFTGTFIAFLLASQWVLLMDSVRFEAMHELRRLRRHLLDGNSFLPFLEDQYLAILRRHSEVPETSKLDH